MKPRGGIGLTHCPNCGARIVPTPRELKRWRKAANLSQRKLAALLKITASHVAYLENGKRSPSGSLIERYRRFLSAGEKIPH
ncbi:helix-turn-helix domain-containing protein [Candidatus Binatus sp.]|uniref:helix-turn-helix domain-containing protein n=1 Tax=Candidatus Binatus sp. TaxID=2811406 RepID=UPI003C6EA8CE